MIFQTSKMDLSDDRYVRSIWIWDGEVRQFTTGSVDASPKWSPDGTSLAFIRKGPGDKDIAQLAVMPADGGEASIITDFALGVRQFDWSPDSKSLLALATVWTEEWADLDDEERARAPRKIIGSNYRFDSRGWVHDRREHVFVVDVSGTDDPVRVGKGDENEFGAAWSPDGSRVAFLSTLDDPRGMRQGSDVVVVELSSGVQTTRSESTGFAQLVYSLDGTLHAIGHDAPDYPNLTSLWRLDENETTDLTGHTDRSIFSFLLPPEMAVPSWTEDGFYIGSIDSGRVGLVRFTGDDVAAVLGGDRYVTGYAMGIDGSMYFTAQDPLNPGELFLRDADGAEHQLSNFNEDFVASAALVAPAHYRVQSEEGVGSRHVAVRAGGRGAVPGTAQHPRWAG